MGGPPQTLSTLILTIMTEKSVLHLIPGMGGGGAERQLVYLCRGLAHLGWQVHVGLLAKGPNFSDLEKTCASIHLLRARSSYDPALPVRIVRLMRSVNPAVVQTWLEMMDVLGGATCTAAGKPWVLTQRHSPVRTTGLKWRARNALAARASAVISNSAEGQVFWSRALPRGVRSAMIPNALPLDELDAVPPVLVPRVRKGQKVILYTGRIDAEKNLGTLILALKILEQSHDFMAFLVGEGELRGDMESLVRRNGLEEKVFLPGYKPRGEIWGLMKGVDLFVSISTREGMPNTVMEAMGCGCRLVLSDIPEHRGFVPAECTTFVDPLEVRAVAAGLREALDDGADRSRRAARLREVSEGMTIETMAGRYEAVYHDILR
jgi:glycosyltransferase involved in cell wall biosynthesis